MKPNQLKSSNRRRKRLLTHGAAVMVGIAFAAALSHANGPAAAKDPGGDSTSKVTFRRTSREVVIPPRELLRTLTKVPMERSAREDLKRELHSDWAKRDPLGFLNFFEHRPWPEYVSQQELYEALLQTQPEELLAYARRAGCSDAIEAFVNKADVYQVIDTLGADGLAKLPDDELSDFVRRGEEADPRFHERLSEITDEEARKEAFSHVADCMTEAGRLDDLLAFVRQHPEVMGDDSMSRNFAELLMGDPREIKRLDELPEPLRVEIAEEMISCFDDDLAESARRDILVDLAARGLLQDSGMEVFEMIAERAEDLPPEALEEWKTWAIGLPQNESTRPLRVGAVAMWAFGSHAGPDPFMALPPGELRDAAVVGVIAAQLQEENLLAAKRLAGQIGDAKLRVNLLHYMKLTEAGEEPDDFDPFGFGKGEDESEQYKIPRK